MPDRDPPTPIDLYVAGFGPPVRGLLEQLRDAIREEAPGATEKLSYAIPTFHQHENLVHFAGYARHVGFYPGPSGIAAFADELARWPGAKGSVQFPLDAPLPLELVRRITRHRLAEAEARAAQKRSKRR
ncbi:MAG: DUF1801 domain-containing protein [Myxococcota bacterium]